MLFIAFGARGDRRHRLALLRRAPAGAASPTMVAMMNADMVGRLRDDRCSSTASGTAQGLAADSSSAPSRRARASTSRSAARASARAITPRSRPCACRSRSSSPACTTTTTCPATRPTRSTPRARSASPRSPRASRSRSPRRPTRLAFVDAPADPHRGVRGGFKVSLGTMPDYAFTGKGVRLTATRPDAPAARAGHARAAT